MKNTKIVNGRNGETGREMKQYILVHIPRENREIKAVLWIRSDPKLIEISGSGKNNFGSKQLRIRMNLRQFFNKNAQFKNKNSFLSPKNVPTKLIPNTHTKKEKG